MNVDALTTRLLCFPHLHVQKYGFIEEDLSENHYENMPMQYTEIFGALNIENFQLKNFDIFFISAQNIDCGYTSNQRLCFHYTDSKIPLLSKLQISSI